MSRPSLRHLASWLALALVAFLAAPLRAAPAAPVTSAPIELQQFTLPNGLRVLICERHTVPVVSTMIWYRVGSAAETSGDEGLAHFLEHMMFKGTNRYQKGEIDLVTMKNGGTNNAFTTWDYTAYFFNFASDRWEQALEIEANRMRRCLFASREVEAERKVVIEELKRDRDSPWGALTDEVQSMAYVVHPYHHPIIGFQETLERVPRERLVRFYERAYSPRNATLVLVGDLDATRAMRKVRRLFGRLSGGVALPAAGVAEPPQLGEKRLLVRDSGEVPRLLIAYRGPRFHSREAVVLNLAGNLLSSGKSSRLYRKLVEELKLASSVDTLNDARRDPGLFLIQVELHAGADTAKVEAAVDEELRKLATQDASPAELARARNIALADFIFEQETASGLATKLGYFDTLADRAFLDGYTDVIGSIGASDVRTVAAGVFVPSSRTIGVSLPSASSSPQAAPGRAGGAASGRRAWYRPPGMRPDAGSFRRQSSGPARVATGTAASAPASPAATGAVSRLGARRTVLANGLTVLLLENHSLPIVAVRAYVKADRRCEPAGREGLAEFVGRMLDEGTPARTADQLAEAIESVGGKLVSDSNGLRLQTLSRDLGLALDLASDCLMNAAFASERVMREKTHLLSEIRGERDDPTLIAQENLRELVYGSHPLHAPRHGYEKSIGAITPKELQTFHSRYYRPGNTTLAIVGDFSVAELMPKLEAAFGKWEARPVVFPPLPALERARKPIRKAILMDKEQLNICIGHLGVKRSSPDYYPLLLMDNILGTGSGFTDRLSRKLRDEKGLAYTVYANMTDTAAEEPGLFQAYIGTSPENRQGAIDGILEEMRAMRDRGCTAEELANAKAYLTGSFVFNLETPSQLADFLVECERFNLGPDYIERYPALLRAVTVAEVGRVARAYLDPDAAAVVVVGKAEAASRLSTAATAATSVSSGPTEKP
jgi:zinc protease